MATVADPAAQAASTEGAPAARAGRFLFGHQSVGGNVLLGIEELDDVVKPRVVDLAAGGTAQGSGIHHVRIGRNGMPESKLEAFAAALDGMGDLPDAALMKFCYVDVTASTNAERLFEAYRTRMSELRERHPGLVLVHVTMPLTADRGTWVHWRTVLRGRGASSARRANAIRQRYNELLRQEYAGREPIFDLAQIESTAPDGSRVTVRYAGERVPVLARAYTDDGGHLNAEGRRRAARALLATLATL